MNKFKKPLPKWPFEKLTLGEGQLVPTKYAARRLMFSGLGASNTERVPGEEIDAYVALLKREDGGKVFLKIMCNFEYSVAFRELCQWAVQDVPYPVQAVWRAEVRHWIMSGTERD